LLTVITSSVEATIALGERIGKLVSAGDFIALTGELGSGKTHFARGVAVGLGVDPSLHVTSPTYTLMNSYAGRLPLYHFDLYRLNSTNILDAEAYEEYFYGDGVTVIEWADKIRTLLPSKYVEVSLAVAGENKRKIEIKKR
jgi:tRNA threonylcarbamoyladenosine biosynthesis protein TsaE